MGIQSTAIFNQIQKLKYLVRTGIAVDIQNLGKNTQCIAVREQESLQEIYSGVWLKTMARDFSPYNFTNISNVYWKSDAKHLVQTIQSSNTPFYLADQVRENPRTIATINGGFFFIVDEGDRTPIDLPYNLCIRNGKIMGLPSWDHPIAYIQDGKLHTRETKATGEILIGEKKLSWVGANSVLKQTNTSDAVMYNSKCSDVKKVRDANNIQIGILDSQHIFTPKGTDFVDIVVGRDEQGSLIVTHINILGGTHYFEGLFILQIPQSLHSFSVGQKVVPLTLDTLDLRPISSGITIGRSVRDPFFLEEVRVDRRDVRSVIAEDRAGNIHMFVFDGSKYIPGFNGVSARDISEFFAPDKFKWAYFLDGGGSSRIIVREDKHLEYLANEFVFIKLPDGTHLWDWKRGRMLASSIVLRVAGN